MEENMNKENDDKNENAMNPNGRNQPLIPSSVTTAILLKECLNTIGSHGLKLGFMAKPSFSNEEQKQFYLFGKDFYRGIRQRVAYYLGNCDDDNDEEERKEKEDVDGVKENKNQNNYKKEQNPSSALDDSESENCQSKIVPHTIAHYNEIMHALKLAAYNNEDSDTWFRISSLNNYNGKFCGCISFLDFSYPFDNLKSVGEKLKALFASQTDKENCPVDDKSSKTTRDLFGSQFLVKPELIKELEWNWKRSHFFPSSVRIVPDKVSIHTTGAKIDPHKDESSNGYVGSVILVLFDDTEGNLVVDDCVPNFNTSVGVGFYSHVVHELKPITKKGGILVTTTFKVFANPSPIQNISDFYTASIVNARQQIRKIGEKYHGFGIVTRHKFSRVPKPLDKPDQLVKSVLESLNLPKFFDVNIAESFYLDAGKFGEEFESASRIYLIRDEEIAAFVYQGKAVCGESSIYRNSTDSPFHMMPFFVIPGKYGVGGFEYFSKYDDDGFTESESNLTLYRAFLIPS